MGRPASLLYAELRQGEEGDTASRQSLRLSRIS